MLTHILASNLRMVPVSSGLVKLINLWAIWTERRWRHKHSQWNHKWKLEIDQYIIRLGIAEWRTFSWGNWTLCNHSWAIHLIGAVLIDAMEMNWCCLVLQAVFNVDNHSISEIGVDRRAWPLPIDADSGTHITIWWHRNPIHLPIVSYRFCRHCQHLQNK